MGNVKLKTLTKPLYWAPQSSPLLCHCKNRKIWDCCEILNKLVYRQELLGCSKMCRCWWQMAELVRFLCSLVSWSAWSVELTSMECGADQHGVWSWPAWSVELTSVECGADQHGAWSWPKLSGLISWWVWSVEQQYWQHKCPGPGRAIVQCVKKTRSPPSSLPPSLYCILYCTVYTVFSVSVFQRK